MTFKRYLIILAFIVAFNANAQQGLFISGNRASSSSIETFHELGFSAWHQTSADKTSRGVFYMLHKYQPQTLTSFRLYSGLSGSGDKLHNVGDFNSYLIKSTAPGWEIGSGASKLFPQTTNKFELALNGDLHISSRYPTINDIRLKLITYHARAGVEIIPFPGKISFYGNVNFILGASGTKQFLQKLDIPEDTDPLPILKKAEYFDAGIKYRLHYRSFVFTSDVNLIFAERRIVTKSTEQDWVIPNISFDLSFLVPIEK